jgi:hypothetical protein
MMMNLEDCQQVEEKERLGHNHIIPLKDDKCKLKGAFIQNLSML